MRHFLRIKFFILTLLCCSNLLFSQIRFPPHYPLSHLEINSDYKLCLFYLTNYESGQKTEAIYDSAEELGGKILVSLGGQFGLINDDLTYLIKPNYERIDLVFSVNDFFWRAEKNGKTTLFDYAGNEKIPPIYDKIELDFNKNPHSSLNNHQFYPNFVSNNPHYFRVINDGKIGILDLNGELLFPLEYDKIELAEYVENPNVKAISSFFWIVEKAEIREVFTFNKYPIYSDTIRSFPTSSGFISQETPPSIYSRESPILLLSDQSEGWYRLLNLKTGDLTKQAYYHPLITKQGIIAASTTKNGNERIYFNEDLKVLLVSETGEIVSKWYLKELVYVISDDGVGLIDKNGQMLIPANYKDIGISSYLGGSYFWAEQKGEFRSENGKTIESKFDIYDKDLKLITTQQCESIHMTRVKIRSLQNNPSNDLIRYSYNGRTHDGNLILARKNDKYGGMNAKGEVVFPFIYDYEPQPIKIGNEANEVGYRVRQNDKYGIINEENKIIYPFEYDIIDDSWRYLDLLHFRKNGQSTLIDGSYNVLIENADTIILESFYDLPSGLTFLNQSIRPEYRLILAIKNDSLYTSNARDSFQLCDSTVLKFDNEVLVYDSYLVYKSGHVKRLKTEGKFEKCPNYLLEILRDTGRVFTLAGDYLTDIPEFSTARIVDQYLLVQLTNKRVGLRSKDGLNWIVEPIYEEIILDSEPSLFWVKNWDVASFYYYYSDNIKGKWLLINDKGEQQLNGTEFNYPPISLPNSAKTSIAFVGDKVGILNKDLEFILAPEYDIISPTEMTGVYYIKKDGLWALFHVTGGISMFYNDLSESTTLPVFQSITYTENDTLIGFIHYNYIEGFELLVQPKPWKNIRDSIDLAFLFYDLEPFSEAQKNGSRYFWTNIQTSNEFQKELIPFNNYYIVNEFNWYVSNKIGYNYYNLTFPRVSYYSMKFAGVMIPERIMSKDKVSWRVDNKDFSYTNVRSNDRKKFIYFNNGFYSEIDFENEDGAKKNVFANYIFSNSTDKITFFELFKSKEKANAFFYNYMENLVNERQSFGPVCLNFARVYENYITNFCFVEGGILFRQYCPDKMSSYESASEPRPNGNDIFIPYADIEPYLVRSIRRLGEW